MRDAPSVDNDFRRLKKSTDCDGFLAHRLSTSEAQTHALQTSGSAFAPSAPRRYSSLDDELWPPSYMHYDLGYFDMEQRTLQPLDNPFGTRLSPMS